MKSRSLQERGCATCSEFQEFDGAMRKILSVSHEELKRREEEWKRQAKARNEAVT
jgi:hypothetical protein